MAAPAFGLTDVGILRKPLGDFTAELRVTGTSSTELRWIKADGKPQSGVPKTVRETHPDDLKAIKQAAKDIEKFLPSQRDRIDSLALRQKSWPFAVWAERYHNHPLVGTLARRLIWTFTDASDTQTDAVSSESRFVGADGRALDIDTAKSTVRLWHPIGRTEQQIMAWREFFESRQVRQPFKQAHREVYILTDAERNTGVYSNRFASHLLRQHQFNALCSVRGWSNRLRLLVDDTYPPATIDLKPWNLRAEFWIEGAGEEYGTDTNEAGVYNYITTDQVRFYPIQAPQNSAHAGGGGYSGGGWRRGPVADPIPLQDIPPLVLSEVMRDVDLFVGVASVGNDPRWADGGRAGGRDYWQNFSFGELTETAQTRRQLLQRLIPRLKIADRCSFDGRYLIVRGDVRTYKIHLGSSNILMEPNDQYLCIVTARGEIAGPASKVFLPFEGDRTLSVILSKAFLLAEDKKITDPTILSQINRK